MTASTWLAVAALAAMFSMWPAARLSRWRYLSPWCTVCVLAGAALLVASGAADGHWPAVAAGAVIAAAQGRIAVCAARARACRRAAEAGLKEAAR